MIRLHYTFLFSLKTQKVPFGILGLFLLIIGFNANLFASKAFIEADYLLNYRLFILDTITSYMLIDIIVINLVVVHAFIINWYDIQLIQRKTRLEVITSKISVLLMYTLWLVLIMILMIGIIGEIRGYDMWLFIVEYLPIAILFHCYFLMIMILFAILYQTIWQTMIPVFGFLVAFIFTSDMELSEQNQIIKLIHLFFPTIMIDREVNPGFLYGNVIVFSMILTLVVLVIKKYQTINLS
jgi:hypothetical protein